MTQNAGRNTADMKREIDRIEAMADEPAAKSASPSRKWISLAVLFFVNLLNYMDRYTVSAVLNVSSRRVIFILL